MAWSRAFQKCIIFHFLEKKFFANIFTLELDFAIKLSNYSLLESFYKSQMISKKNLPNTTFSVQPPNIANHALPSRAITWDYI